MQGFSISVHLKGNLQAKKVCDYQSKNIANKTHTYKYYISQYHFCLGNAQEGCLCRVLEDTEQSWMQNTVPVCVQQWDCFQPRHLTSPNSICLQVISWQLVQDPPLSYGLDSRHDHKSRWQLAWIKFTVVPIKTEEAGPGFISVSAMGGYKQMTCQKHMPRPLGDDHTNSLLSLDPNDSDNSTHMLKQINRNSIKYKYQNVYAKFANGSQMHLDCRQKRNN